MLQCRGGCERRVGVKFRLPGTMEARSLRGCIETTRIARSWMPTSKHVRFAEANLSICGFCGQHLEHTRALPIPPFVEPEPVFIAARNMQPAESPPAEEALRIEIQSVLASTRNHRGGDGGCDSHFDIFCSLFRVQAPWRTSCNRTQMVHLSCWRRQPTQVRSSERRRPYYRPKTTAPHSVYGHLSGRSSRIYGRRFVGNHSQGRRNTKSRFLTRIWTKWKQALRYTTRSGHHRTR